MVEMRSQQLLMSSSVDCKSHNEDNNHSDLDKLSLICHLTETGTSISVVLLVRLLQILPPLLKVELLLQT